MKQYFENFHPSFPLLHRPTFAVSSTPKLLLRAVTVIGSLFSPQAYNQDETQALSSWRQDVWQRGQEELQQIVYEVPLLLYRGRDVLIKSALLGILKSQ